MVLLYTLVAAIIVIAILWLLVSLLLFAQKKLLPGGKVKILINDTEEIEHEKGCSLLQALSDQQIFVPSACGGGGTCGMCKGQVLAGGGSALPTELPHLSKKEINEHYRLFCQVKVRNDMQIQIPEEIFGVKKWECTVLSNRNVSTYIKEFVVALPQGETLDFKSGGYIQIDVPPISIPYHSIEVNNEYREEWEKYNMFALTMKNEEYVTRAYSMANHPAENNQIMLNVRIATPPFDAKKGAFQDVNPGVVSSYIFSRKPGDKVTLSGPYGEFFIQPTENEMMFIGGGAGMAPMRSHLFDLFLTKKTNRKTTFWYGGRSVKELFYMDDFTTIEKENPNFKFNVALSAPLPEDNWDGHTGFIHQVIYDQYLKDHKAPEEIEYYICGPGPMLAALLEMLDQQGVPKEMIHYDDFGA